MERSLAIVVHACDRYQVLYKAFEFFFTQYWPAGAGVSNYYFLTEEADHISPIFKNIKTGKGEWSERLVKGLQQIPEKQVLYLQEDMWFCKAVDRDTADKVIDFATAQNTQLFKLNSSEVFKTRPTDVVINGLRIGILDNEASSYLMSHQATIWNKELLLGQLQEREHPWRNERKGTERLRKMNLQIHHIDLFSENGKNPVNENTSILQSGAYMTVSVNAQLNDLALAFINELKKTNDAEYIDYAFKLAYNYHHKLTHDGKPKPRKNIFGK